MDRSEKILHTNRRSFVKAYWLFGVVLAILTVFVVYLLVRVYRASSLLAEASRQSFAQEAKSRVSVLNEYFERLSSGVETLSNSRALHAYFQNKALGMSLEYGLAVAVAEVRDEFERYQRTVLAKGRPVSQQITFLDAQEMRVIAETKPLSNAHSIDAKQLGKVLEDSKKSPVFGVTETGSEWVVFVVRSVTYKAAVRGYLLMKLDMRTLQAQIQIDEPQKNDDFDGIVDSRGILLVGPREFLGENISEFLGVSPQSLGEFRVIDIQNHRLGGVCEPLIVSGGQVPHVPFYLVSVAPTSRYLAGYSASLWGMIFTGLMTGLVIMVIFIIKSLLEQSKMYGQLEEARDTLEVRVRERTSELGETNLRLQGEIKERTRTEEALQASEEKYRKLVEKALEGIVVAQHGVLRFANREASDIIGYDPEELLDRPFTDFIHPDHAEMVLQRHMRRLKGEQFPSRYSFKILRKDGHSRWVEIDSGLISWEGQPAVLFFMSDITERKQMEDELKQSEVRYMSLYSMMRLMCDNVPDLIWAKDLERRFLFVNRAASEKVLCAKDTEEPVGKTDMFFAQRERSGHLDVPNWHTFGEICIDSDVVVMDTREPRRFDEFGNVKGEFLYLDVYKAPFWNEQAEMIGTVGCGRDVTRERRIEESLRESEARYRDLFEYASDLIYTHDLSGNFTSVNGVVRSLLGYTSDEFLTLHFHDIVDPQSLQTTDGNFLRKVLDGVETTGPYEIMVRTKEGALVCLEVTSRIIRHEGSPVGIHGIARNITERKNLEAAVHEAQMKYQSVVQAFDGIIHISSPNYEIEFANQRLIERTGYDPVGKKCFEVLHGLNEVCPWCKYGKEPREETFRRERFSPKDNRWYYVLSSPMVHRDGSMSRIFLMQDINELKRSEGEKENLTQQLVQAQKMEAVGTLAGGIAHDFNNLLQVVLGYSQLLLAKKNLNSPEYDHVKKISIAARSAADLVKGLLAFSRKAIMQPRPLDLNYQVTEVISLLERTIPKMIKIELRLEEDLPVIHADSGQIEQILMNLGVNARDAMPDGGVLTIETSNVLLDQDYCRNHIGAKPGRHVMLTVSDTGQGIDKDSLEHIFEPFYTTKDVGKGTGLGLSMVYGLVKQHDGYISCESQRGHGTMFRIYFPAVENEKEKEERVDVSSPPGGFETLLMVDDEEVVRELGSDYLRQAGYTVLTASNGKEALEVYQEKQADVCLVLLDLIMPEMGGRKCFKELLKINPTVKVLIVSGYTSGGTEKDAVELGARGFVEKPYDLTKLLQIIRDVLDED